MMMKTCTPVWVYTAFDSRSRWLLGVSDAAANTPGWLLATMARIRRGSSGAGY